MYASESPDYILRQFDWVAIKDTYVNCPKEYGVKCNKFDAYVEIKKNVLESRDGY